MRARRGARVLALLCLAGLLLAPGISRGDTVIGKALRAGVLDGKYCYTSSFRCDHPYVTPSTTRVKVSWGTLGIFALGGQIFNGSIVMKTFGTVVESTVVDPPGDASVTVSQTLRLDRFRFVATDAGKTIAGFCTGRMTIGGIIRIDLSCTGQITGGSVATAKVIILAVDDTEYVENGDIVCAPFGGCGGGPDLFTGRYFSGVYLL